MLSDTDLVAEATRWLTTKMEKPRLVCSWCTTVIREGDREQPTSHGMCKPCFDMQMAELDTHGGHR